MQALCDAHRMYLPMGRVMSYEAIKRVSTVSALIVALQQLNSRSAEAKFASPAHHSMNDQVKVPPLGAYDPLPVHSAVSSPPVRQLTGALASSTRRTGNIRYQLYSICQYFTLSDYRNCQLIDEINCHP